MNLAFTQTFAGVFLLACIASARASLSVNESADGTLSLLRDGETLVSSVEAVTGEPKPAKIEKSFQVAADGAKVWNRWTSDKEGRFRLEVVQRPDGAIELSLLGEGGVETKNRLRELRLNVPKRVFEGGAWRSMTGNGSRSQCEGGTKDAAFLQPRKGIFGKDSLPGTFRWLETAGLVWDFNPFGPKGRHHLGEVLIDKSGDYVIRRLTTFSWQKVGGNGESKLVIREGRYEDYFKYHFHFDEYYEQRLPGRLFSLAAPKAGVDYTPGNVSFDEEKGNGWLGQVARRTVVGHRSGAYYSHVAGSGKDTYRIVAPVDGYYLLSVQIGNFTGTDNRFSVTVNGTELGRDLEVPKGKARTLVRAVRITGGHVDFSFDGKWIVSALGVQPLMTDAEDFTVRRGFWYVNGYNPSRRHWHEYYAKPAVFPVSDETIDMPVPGEEASGKYREPPRPVELPDPNLPSLKWLRQPRYYGFLGNGLITSEVEDDAGRRQLFVEARESGCNAVMNSFMLSRHTYPEELIRYGQEMTAKIVKDAHAEGLAVIDHPDATLLWNCEMGFRVLMERLPQTLRSRYDQLPSPHLCPNNPEMKKWFFAYLRKQVESGVDGFQIDELEFWPHGCTCKVCREKFHAETGWWYPLDETDPTVTANAKTVLAKRWFEWRYKTVANWFVEFRRSVKDLRPDLVLSMYNHHWAFMSSMAWKVYSTDLLELGRVINFLGAEVLANNVIEAGRTLVPLRRLYNVLNKLYGAPLFGFYYNPDMTRRYFSWAVANMSGQAAILGEMWSDPKVPDFFSWGSSSANMNRVGAEPVAEVALLFSRHSREWNTPVNCYCLADLMGLAQELDALSIPYEFIGDANVTPKDLAKYKILFLGLSQSLSDGEIAEIKAFAARGGKVYLCEGSGMKDETGEYRRESPFARELADPESNIRLQPLTRDFYAWEPSYPNKFSYNPDVEKQKKFRKYLREQVGDAGFWRTKDIPEKVFTFLWHEQSGSLAIHFLNGTGARVKFGENVPRETTEPAFPALEKDIRFAVPASEGTRAVVVSPDFKGERSLPVDVRDGWLRVTLPKDCLKAYSMVRILK